MRSRILPLMLVLAVGAALGAAGAQQLSSPAAQQPPSPAAERPPGSAADHPPTDDEVNAVAKKLYCPVCPNTPLDVCETQACVEWRAQIRDQLARGWGEEAVIDYFAAQYGERVLAEPRRGGFTSLLWVLPVVVVAFGLVALGVTLRRWRVGSLGQSLPPRAAPADLPDVEIPPDVRARIEKELQKLS